MKKKKKTIKRSKYIWEGKDKNYNAIKKRKKEERKKKGDDE